MKNNNRNAIIISVVLAIVFIAIAAFATTKKVVDTPTEYPTNLYTDLRSGFMEGCVDGKPAMSTFCTCVYDNLENTYGINGLVKLSEEYDRTGVLPSETTDSINNCSNLIK